MVSEIMLEFANMTGLSVTSISDPASLRTKREVEMLPFAEMTDEERLARLERKAAETRKMLFGALLLAKDALRDELSLRGEGLELMKAMEKAEESFTEGSQPGRFKRLEHTLDVSEQRASSIFEVMSYISKYGRHV